VYIPQAPPFDLREAFTPVGRATGPSSIKMAYNRLGMCINSPPSQFSGPPPLARLAPTAHPLDDIGSRLYRRFYPTYAICGIVLPIALLISRLQAVPNVTITTPQS
jgi:hypothetical protein